MQRLVVLNMEPILNDAPTAPANLLVTAQNRPQCLHRRIHAFWNATSGKKQQNPIHMIHRRVAHNCFGGKDPNSKVS